MNRMIFFRELRSAAAQEAGGLLLILILFLAIERWGVYSGQALEQIRPGIDASLLAIVALWGFATGARCFPEDLKRRRFLYLYSLPLSRSRLWISLVAGRLTAGLLSLAALLLLRPSILQEIRDVREDISLALPWFLALYFVLLTAGLCFSQVFQRTLIIYLTGYPAVLFLLFQVLGYLNDGVPRNRFWQSSSNLVWLSTGSFLLFLGLSWRFFVIGESGIRRRTLINQVSLAMILSGALVAVGVTSRLLPLEGSWLQIIPRSHSELSFPSHLSRHVSAGGRYLAVAERLAERPAYSRIYIIETATGRVVGTRRWRGLEWVGWSGQGEILQVVISPTPIHDPWAVRKPEAAWIRLDPSGRELSRRRLGVFLNARSLADGATLLLDRQGTEARLLRLEGDGRAILLVRVSSLETPRIASLRKHGALFTNTAKLWSSTWHIEGLSARELDSPPWPFLKLAGDDLLEKEVMHLFGSPKRGLSILAPAHGDYLILNRAASVFALGRQGQTVSFLMRRRGSSGWVQLSAGFPSDRFIEDVRWRHSSGWGLTRSDYRNIQADQGPSISFLDGLALYLPTGGADGRISLYDGSLDREIPLPACQQGRVTFPEMISAHDELSWLLRFRCLVRSPFGVQAEFRSFYYVPGSGQPKNLSASNRALGEEPIFLAYLDERTAIWSPGRGETWKILRDGQIRTLWPPQAPLD